MVELYRILGQRVVEQALVARLDLPAAHENPALVTLESGAVLTLVGAQHSDAARVNVFDVEFRVGVVAIVAGVRSSAGCLDPERTGAIHPQAPVCDVVVMGAPVGQLAAGVLQPPAKVPVRPLGNVVRIERRPEPHIPVQVLRHGLSFERPAGRPGGKVGFNLLDPADPAVAHKFARQAKPAVRALLAADLEDTLGLTPDLHQFLALVNRQGQRLLAVDVLARPHRGD